ncbi:hypothetical protein AB1K89_06900 [Sporosarcina sp. 179-K 8C2 HS]|uniref:hypothetical protein n=1 Tax=Sporosarcina sp. 179-K 8C2 HS TaxID=3142387 RepID=UPI0039A1A884
MNPNEFDKYFDHLKKVGRSNEMKSKTLSNIILQSENKKYNYQRRQRFKLAVISLMSALIATLLLVTYIGGEEVNQTGAGVEIEVKEILLAKSKSDKTFQATSISNSIKIDSDSTFENEVKQLFKHLKLLSTPPTYNTPAFDMTVRQESGNPFKVKIWEYDGDIYIYNIEQDQYYTSTNGSASRVYRMLRNIPHLQ